MDKRIRVNEICCIGLPRCDYAFSSTRSCFIAYGFEDSPLELSILKRILESKGIEAVEAGGHLAPAQNAFCAKICSKIIAAQFCIVLINNDTKNGTEIPNANVNMEYGLMLGFNKFVIPFQRASQRLPFNVAGLDTVKYSDKDFERLASQAIDDAISKSSQERSTQLEKNANLETFLIGKKLLYTSIEEPGEKNIFLLGSQLGFNLLNSFSGMKYTFLGNFTNLRPEAAIWRVKMLAQILHERRDSIGERIGAGIVDPTSAAHLDNLFGGIEILIIVTSNEDKSTIMRTLDLDWITQPFECYSTSEIEAHLSRSIY